MRARRHILSPVALLALACLFLLVACGGNVESAVTATPGSQLAPEEGTRVAEGERLFSRHCASCHATEADAVIVGPSLAGIAGRAQMRVDGLGAEVYLEQSIVRPDAYLVEGYENVMPATLGKRLTGEELDALVAYLLTLK